MLLIFIVLINSVFMSARNRLSKWKMAIETSLTAHRRGIITAKKTKLHGVENLHWAVIKHCSSVVWFHFIKYLHTNRKLKLQVYCCERWLATPSSPCVYFCSHPHCFGKAQGEALMISAAINQIKLKISNELNLL